jgi:hypothetical protein
MNHTFTTAGTKRSAGAAKIVLLASTLAITGSSFAVWPMLHVIHIASGSAERSFTLPLEFNEFKQIMMKPNANQAIVACSGMTLLEEKVLDLDIDMSRDRRPVLNALLGRSKSEVRAKKLLILKLDDPKLDVQQLSLTQHAHVKAGNLNVRTEAEPTGKIAAYISTLEARKDGEHTVVAVTIDQSVRVRLPFFMINTATQQVQEAADTAAKDLEQSIKNFLADSTDHALALHN